MNSSLFLPDELLLQYNFFELYPFDGGGNFIQQEIVHSLDDRKITENILNGALDDFGPLEKIDFRKFECWEFIEKSCWINRMYFIVSLARTACLEHDRNLAEKILRIVTHFNEDNPPPPDRRAVQNLNREVLIRRDRDYNSGNAMGPIPYQWYDFQPASRILNILHAMHFLREFSLPTQEFDRLVADCARVIHDSDDEHNLYNGNHQSLRGLALLYAGHYLNNPEYLRAGNVIARYHLKNDFCKDGMGVDMSPSYHVFVSWISRDVLRIGSIPADEKTPLLKVFRICREFCQPDMQSIVLNDGYHLDMRGFLESIGENTASNEERCFVLPESGMAFHRSPNVFLALDASKCLQEFAHFHGGKNAVTLWFGGHPLLADSGCCSYDNPAFADYFKQPEAHSTLLINGEGDAQLQGRYRWSHVRQYQMGQWNSHTIECSSSCWSRKITITPQEEVIIEDRVNCPETADLQLIFILHPSVEVHLGKDRILLSSPFGKTVSLTWQSSVPLLWKVLPGKFFDDNRIFRNSRLAACVRSGSWVMRTSWHREDACL